MGVKVFLFGIILIMTVSFILWVAYSNRTLEIKTFQIESEYLPKEFDGFKIAQISDLHNTEFGRNNQKLISMLNQTEADIIVITGDIIDSRKTSIDKAVHFAEEAAKIAPAYYVSGNHESRLSDIEYSHLIARLEQAGVTVLENGAVDISIEDEKITLIGINDPTFSTNSVDDSLEQNIAHQLMSVVPENDNYKILLAHRPEYLDVYEGKVDLVFSGHAHGGQFILPFTGGLIAPGQGLFPKYFDGLYQYRTTSMIVSRGIGNSIFPFRVNNQPVIVVAELSSLEES